MAENLGFTDRVINKLRPMSIESLHAQALHDYLVGWGRIGYNLDRNLFAVKLTDGTWEVATWMMPVCLAAEEEGGASRSEKPKEEN